MPDDTPESSTPSAEIAEEIEVGAVGGDLRFFRAKEALRQGEAALASQAGIRSAMETRATALTGWASVNLLAAVGGAFAAKTIPTIAGLVCAGAVLFISAAIGIQAARPRDWALVGYSPKVLLDDKSASELELCEAVAEGITIGVRANNKRLASMGTAVKWAGWLLIAAPAVAAAGYFSPAIWSAIQRAAALLL